MPSLRKNALYSTAYEVIRLIFPIITFPYVSRIIGPEGVGKVSYAQTIATYFTTFILLGIPMYGSREISISRKDPKLSSEAFSGIITLSVILTTLGFLIYGLLYVLAPQVCAESALHWAFGLIILFYWARIDWFYKGIEEYKFITIRNLFVRCLALAAIFVFIHKKEDYTHYGFIWAGETLVVFILNIAISFKYIKISFKNLNLKKHLLGSLPSALISSAWMLYAVLDTIMLGIMLDDDRYSVGIYAVAGRLLRISMSFITAGNAVLAPRIALKNEEGKTKDIVRMIRKNILYTSYFSLPLVVGLITTSDYIIPLFAGNGFQEAILTLRIIAPQLLLMSLSSILSNQILYARGKDQSLLTITVIVLIVGFVLNLIFIPIGKQDGAALATLITRFLELIILAIIAFDMIKQTFDVKGNLLVVLSGGIWCVLLVMIKYLLDLTILTMLMKFIIVVAAGAFLYAILSSLFRIEPAMEILGFLKAKINGKKS